MAEFEAFPKIPRLRRPITITEKIDGTNAAVVVTECSEVYAQSRKRVITPLDDNFGFASWVDEHKFELVDILGPGRHYGEWWGKGIQRGYGLDHKRFSLFNVTRWESAEPDYAIDREIGLHVVPTLMDNTRFSDWSWEWALDYLTTYGSMAARGFERPEGIVVYHTAAGQLFKVLLENDELPKGVTTWQEREAAAERAAS